MKIEYKGLVFSDLSVSEATMLAQALQKSTKKDNPIYERARRVYRSKKVRAFHWSAEEDARCIELVKNGISTKEIAKQLGRSYNSVGYRKAKVLAERIKEAKPEYAPGFTRVNF